MGTETCTLDSWFEDSPPIRSPGGELAGHYSHPHETGTGNVRANGPWQRCWRESRHGGDTGYDVHLLWAVVMLVAGCIYPLLTLWFLSRPGVKLACRPAAEATPEEL